MLFPPAMRAQPATGEAQGLRTKADNLQAYARGARMSVMRITRLCSLFGGPTQTGARNSKGRPAGVTGTRALYPCRT